MSAVPVAPCPVCRGARTCCSHRPIDCQADEMCACPRCGGAGDVPAWSIVHYAPVALDPRYGAHSPAVRIAHCEVWVRVGADGVRANADGEVYAATSSNLRHVECPTCLALARPTKRTEAAGLGSYAEQMRDAGRGHQVRS